VEVEQNVAGLAAQLGQDRVDLAERGARGLHEQHARHVHDGQPQPGALDHGVATAGAALRVVGRPHDPLLAVEELVRLAMAVGVVAERDRIGADLEQLARRLLGDAHAAGRVLAVDDDEVGPVALAQAGQQRGQRSPAQPAHHVADE